MQKIFPRKLRSGDMVRVISPSRSLALLSTETKDNATRQLQSMGLKVSFGNYSNEKDAFDSSSVEHRVADLHEAFADLEVACILTVIGGFNSNQLLKYIDWSMIRNNPKLFCGYSDISALNNALFAKTGLVNYSGPHYSTFGQRHLNPYTVEYFQKCLFSAEPFSVEPSNYWSDYHWWLEPDRDERLPNTGWITINEGTAEGTLLGANLCTFNLLQGTEYFPDIADAILFLEDDELVTPWTFDRDLQSLIHQPGFDTVRAVVIGRFQNASQMTPPLLEQIIKTKKELAGMAVLANVDFGHTEPKLTLPIGGMVKVSAIRGQNKIEIIEH